MSTTTHIPARILARVTIDESYAALLRDLITYTGRRRAKRIVFLAALGELAERGALQSNSGADRLNKPVTTSKSAVIRSDNDGGLKPLTAEKDDVDFLSTLRESLP